MNLNANIKNTNKKIPDGFIVFISGVPSSGKTTISYELLKRINKFRIIEETDIIRDVLRGYYSTINNAITLDLNSNLDNFFIYDNKKVLSYEQCENQCLIMSQSIVNIVKRQQRRGIATIINGIHIVPEILDKIIIENNLIYINLYINNKVSLYERLYNRDSQSFMLDYLDLIFETNNKLYNSIEKIKDKNSYLYNNIDVTNKSVKDVLIKISNIIQKRIECINN